MANAGLRVLGVAKATFQHKDPLPAQQHDFSFEFAGLVGLADPVRPMVPAAIKECYTAGVRVIMITGDYPGTALHIGQEIGLATPWMPASPARNWTLWTMPRFRNASGL